MVDASRESVDVSRESEEVSRESVKVGTVMARMAAAILSYDDRDEDHDEKDSIFRCWCHKWDQVNGSPGRVKYRAPHIYCFTFE